MKRPVQRVHSHLQLVAHLHVAHGVFRHRHTQAQQAALRQLDDGQRLAVGVGARLNERSGIGIAPGDHAVDGRDHVGVILHRAHPPVVCAGHLGAALGGGQRRLGGIHLRRRGQIFRLGVIQLLLRNQPRLRLGRLLQTVVVGMQRGVSGFCRRPLHAVPG